MPGFRRILTFSLALTMLAMSFAIAAGPSQFVELRAAEAQADDTITIGVTDLPDSLDPGDVYDFAAWEVLSHLYTGLTRQVPGTLEYELVLATDYSVSDDRLTYAFTLVDDATFNDGTPITASTFVDSIQRVLDLRRPAADAITPYVDAVEAIDDLTLVFTLKRPVPYFLGLLSLPPYFPVHPQLASLAQPDPFIENEMIGSGPYTLASFELREEIVLEANPDFAFGPAPATATIVLRYFEKSALLRDALAAHEIDMSWRALYLGHLAQLDTLEGLNIVETPSTRVFYIVMGQNREPTDDPMVRLAVTMLLERDAAVEEVLAGHATVMTSLLPDFFPDAYYPVWPNESDVEGAETVLREAGYSERGRFRLFTTLSFARPVYGDPYTSAVVELSRSSFSSTQFIENTVFTEIEPITNVRMLEDGDEQLGMFAWTPIVANPHAYLYPLTHSSNPIPANGRYASPQIDALLDDAALATDPAEQGEYYREISDWLLEDNAMLPVWQDHLQVAAWSDIEGILLEPNYFLHYDRLVRQP
jgi:peptide/nickel transport system substrate-binding protein